jgi:hypothetical protein
MLAVILLFSGCGGGGGGGGSDLNPLAGTSSSVGITVSGQLTGTGDLASIPVFLVPKNRTTPLTLVSPVRAALSESYYQSVTGPDGSFLFTGVATGVYNLIAQKSRTESAIIRDLEVSAAIVVNGIVLEIKPTGSISGEVSVPTGMAKTGIAAFAKGTSFFAFTDVNGWFQMQGIPVGTYDFGFSGTGVVTGERPGVVVNAAANTALPIVALSAQETRAVQASSIIWKGTLAAAPINPQAFWAYYNSIDKKAYLWSGTAWEILAEDGLLTSTTSTLVWQGTLAQAPANPQLNWGYYNSTDGKSYIWDGDSWEVAAVSGSNGPNGVPGQAGTSFVWKGALSAPPANPVSGWAYYDTLQNTSFVHDGAAWQTLAMSAPGDATPPVITAAQAFQVSTSSLEITLKTNEAAVGRVQSGPTTSYGQISAETIRFEKSHRIQMPLPGLGTYHFRAEARDSSGNLAVSPDLTATLIAPIWNHLYDEGSHDAAYRIVPTADGGALLGGTVSPSSNYDVKLVKVNAAGTVEWTRTIAGDGYDGLSDLQSTSDGGYVFCGTTDSNNLDGTGLGWNDLLVGKVDAGGVVSWLKIFGGSDSESGSCIRQTSDGGYIVLGTTGSNNGWITLKTGGAGNDDMWLLKLSSAGVLQWNLCIGGGASDYGRGVLQETDGRYLVAGYTLSSADGNLTVTTKGGNDVWMGLVSNNGTTIDWQTMIGGSSGDFVESLQRTPDGGSIMAGHSNSSDGDVPFNRGFSDAWLVKFGPTQNIQWSKTFGGSAMENFTMARPTSDGGFLAGGYTSSTDGDVGLWLGSQDSWMVKVDAQGNIRQKLLLGGSDVERFHDVAVAADQNYFLAGYSNSEDTDVGNPNGNDDMWYVKVSSQ